MENKSHALAAGTFVLVVAALLVALAIWLTRDAGVKRVVEFSTHEAVSGLQPQARVRYRGIAVGRSRPSNSTARSGAMCWCACRWTKSRPDQPQPPLPHLGYQGVTGLAFVQLDDDAGNKPLHPRRMTPPRMPLRPSLLAAWPTAAGTMLVQVEEVTPQRQPAAGRRRTRSCWPTPCSSLAQAAAGIQKLLLDGVPARNAWSGAGCRAGARRAGRQDPGQPANGVHGGLAGGGRVWQDRAHAQRARRPGPAVGQESHAQQRARTQRHHAAAHGPPGEDDVAHRAPVGALPSHLGDNPQALLYRVTAEPWRAVPATPGVAANASLTTRNR